MDQNTHCNVASIIEERYAMLGEVRNSLKESQENLLHLRDMLADFDQFNSVGRAFLENRSQPDDMQALKNLKQNARGVRKTDIS